MLQPASVLQVNRHTSRAQPAFRARFVLAGGNSKPRCSSQSLSVIDSSNNNRAHDQGRIAGKSIRAGFVAEPPLEPAFTKEEAMPDTRLKSIKVVAVDDNADSRELLKVILERSSAEAAVVSSGQEAPAAIKDVQPDVLICDFGHGFGVGLPFAGSCF
jgi:PleD family two-component response regulator